MVYLQVFCELFELFTIKLGPIILYKDIRNPKFAYYVAPYEVNHLLSCDASDRLSFWPLREVFYNHYHIFSLAGGLRERSEDINSPLREWPGSWDVGLSYCWCIDHLSKLLTEVTLFHKLFHIRFHGRLVVLLFEDLVSQNGCSFISATGTLVDLLDDTRGLFLPYTPEPKHGFSYFEQHSIFIKIIAYFGWNFLSSFLSSNTSPRLRYLMKGSIQQGPICSCITIVGLLKLSHDMVFINTSHSKYPSSLWVNRLIRLAFSFWAREMRSTQKRMLFDSNSHWSSRTLARYYFIISSHASCTLRIWLTTNCESLSTFNSLTSVPIANYIPLIRASYLTMLFVTGKLKRNTYDTNKPFGPSRIAPPPFWFGMAAPFTYRVQRYIWLSLLSPFARPSFPFIFWFSSLNFFSLLNEHPSMKSANT